MIVYKIRRKTDGLFSTGGLRTKFSKVGKTWNKLNHVNSHIAMLIEGKTKSPQVYDDCELVEFEINEINTTPISKIANAKLRLKYVENKIHSLELKKRRLMNQNKFNSDEIISIDFELEKLKRGT